MWIKVSLDPDDLSKVRFVNLDHFRALEVVDAGTIPLIKMNGEPALDPQGQQKHTPAGRIEGILPDGTHVPLSDAMILKSAREQLSRIEEHRADGPFPFPFLAGALKPYDVP